MNTKEPPPIDLDSQPGHIIRRLHQICVAIFLQETEHYGVTPVQYAALQSVAQHPGIDQRTLARSIGLDTSTTAGVIDRLEARKLVERSASQEDRRVRKLDLTDAGRQLLIDIAPSMLHAQQRMIEPLPAHEQQELLRLLRRLVAENNEFSRAPSDGG
jgi:MarR family transcriptional regulator, lower aerobic nicotinate degradation pathway regulator